MHDAIPEPNECTCLECFSKFISQHGSVGKYSNFISPDAILSFMKKYRIRCVLLLQEPLPSFQETLHSDYLDTVLRHEIFILVTPVNTLSKSICGIILLTDTSELSVELLGLIFGM